MSTMSVGQAMEAIAGQAADYAAAGAPDLDQRVSALADYISESIDGPGVNAPRFYESLFERLDAATEAVASVRPDKRDHPGDDVLQRQKLFFAAMAHQFRDRVEAAIA